MRALCNCDLLLPIEHPTIPAISLCSYPSTSCNTKIERYPGGRASIARCSSRRSMDPASFASGAPSSFLALLLRSPQCLRAELLGDFSCEAASELRSLPCGAARLKTPTHREKYQSCETTAETLPGSGLRLPPCWQSSAGITNTRDAYAGRTAVERLLRHPASLVRLPLIQKACRPVVFLRPSSRLFRPHLVRCGLSVFSLY